MSILSHETQTWCGYFAFDRTQMAEVVTWKTQYRDTKCL